jgi:hypothetical protein
MHSNNESFGRTSNILEYIIDGAKGDGEITIREVLDLLGERAFGLALLVFCLPNSLPIPSPPGFSAITGAPIIILALQMTLGRETPWLPARIGNYSFSRDKFAAFLTKALPYIRKIEKLLHPRMQFFQSWLGERLTGLSFLILGIVLSMPIPLGNFLPGVSMSLIALGLLERDGALIVAGMVLGAFACLVIFTAIDVIASAVFGFLFGG